MMMRAIVFGAGVALAGTADAATLSFVGSWQVDDGVYWQDMPLAYSGQEAAALIFGGSASDYVISTISAQVADINFMAWYSILGVFGGFELDQGLDQALTNGLYYDGNVYDFGNLSNPASAYVDDNAIGSAYTNYAFKVATVPLPASLVLLLAGLAGLGVVARRRVGAPA